MLVYTYYQELRTSKPKIRWVVTLKLRRICMYFYETKAVALKISPKKRNNAPSSLSLGRILHFLSFCNQHRIQVAC